MLKVHGITTFVAGFLGGPLELAFKIPMRETFAPRRFRWLLKDGFLHWIKQGTGGRDGRDNVIQGWELAVQTWTSRSRRWLDALRVLCLLTQNLVLRWLRLNRTFCTPRNRSSIWNVLTIASEVCRLSGLLCCQLPYWWRRWLDQVSSTGTSRSSGPDKVGGQTKPFHRLWRYRTREWFQEAQAYGVVWWDLLEYGLRFSWKCRLWVKHCATWIAQSFSFVSKNDAAAKPQVFKGDNRVPVCGSKEIRRSRQVSHTDKSWERGSCCNGGSRRVFCWSTILTLSSGAIGGMIWPQNPKEIGCLQKAIRQSPQHSSGGVHSMHRNGWTRCRRWVQRRRSLDWGCQARREGVVARCIG